MNTSTPSTGLRGLIAVAIFGAVASGFSAVSAADPTSVSFTVKYADLNIASPSGARVLYERIGAAAQAGCSAYLFETEEDEARCVHNAIANAVVKVNQPALTAVFDAKFKTPARTTLVSQNR
jgi:UrcA family protein